MTELSKWISFSPEEGSDLVQEVAGLSIELAAPTWLEGAGEIEDPVLATRNASGRRERPLRGTWDLISLKGHALPGGEVQLFALIAQDIEAGPLTLGGFLISGRVIRATLRAATAAKPIERATAATPSSPEVPAAASPARGSAPEATSNPAPAAAPAPAWGSGTTALPRRPAQRPTTPEFYPEEGDVVDHFAFGRCQVLESDGERLRLQQDRDGRVREVALSMLRIEEPTQTADNKRLWELARKNL